MTSTLTPGAALRLQENAEQWRRRNFDLAFRRLMDAALDTRDTAVFRRVCAFADAWETMPDETKVAQALELLAIIEQAGVHVIFAPQEPVLEASDISKSYGTARFALGPVSLSLKRGEVLGLVGENGNGKTTLLRILARELREDSGRIDYFINHGGSPYDLRTRLAYIPQRSPKWYGSLKDNLKFTLSSYGIKGSDNEDWTMMMIARMGLWQYKHLQWSELSSGYKMRFELARTFLRRPEILLLDEPLANLDLHAQKTVLEDLRSLAESLAAPIGVVLSSQQLYEVEKVSDRVLFLKQGKPIWQDISGRDNTAEAAPEAFVVELEAGDDLIKLEDALRKAGLQKMHSDGGAHIAYFPPQTTMSEVMNALSEAGVELTYIRDISRSTRRFFVNN